MTPRSNEMSQPSDNAREARICAMRESLLARSLEIGPLLVEHTEAGEKNLALAEAVIDGLTERHLFRMWQPQRYDGLEVDVYTQIVVTAELARHCASAGWVAALYSACSFFAGLYSNEAQEEVFGDDHDARFCGVLAPTATTRQVPGGIKVDGRWMYASGSEHATWATVGAPALGDAFGTTLLLIPMKELTIERTWDPTGMRGTASNTLLGNDVFIPTHRILSFFSPEGAIAGHTATEHTEEALYRTPLAGIASACIVGPLIGMAKAALAHTLDHIVDRPVAYTFATDQSALVSTQLAIANVATKIDSAELHILRAAKDLDQAAESSTEMTLIRRGRVRHDVGHGTQLLREAMEVCQQINGSSDMARGKAFERVWRDFSTSNLHSALSPATTAEVYGKILCGHDPSEFSGLF